MAKRQNFQFGSTTSNIETQTVAQLNHGWEQLSVLYSKVLNGTFAAISEFSYDSSQEIANAVLALTGAQPTGASMTELGDALIQMRQELETSSLTFRGYVSTSAPSSTTYTLVVGNLWINSASMPTTFPIPAADIQQWNGSAWVAYGSDYTVGDFDVFRNINDGEGYYWFGGQWTPMSTDLSTEYFVLNQVSGRWEIKNDVNLPGSPTTTTPAAGDNSNKIPTTAFIVNSFAPLDSPALIGTPTAPTPGSTDNSTNIATTAWVRANMPSISQVLPVGAIIPFGGNFAPSGFFICDGSAISRYDYPVLFATIGTNYGSGDGTTTFNLPNYSDCFVQGGTPGVRHDAGLPDHRHTVSLQGWAVAGGSYGVYTSGGSLATSYASADNAIYGRSNTVQPKSVESKYIIKY